MNYSCRICIGFALQSSGKHLQTFILLTPHQFSIRIRTFLHSDQVPYISNCHRLAEFERVSSSNSKQFDFHLRYLPAECKEKENNCKTVANLGKRVLSARSSHIHS